MRSLTVAAITLSCMLPTTTQGQTVEVVGGATSVALDTTTLAAAASLSLSSVSAGIGAGALPGSVAFPINPRDAAVLATTFAYTPGDFPTGPFSGSIEHTGSVFFNADAVEVGNFTIGYDGARATGGNSGFFVESTTGVAAILFDTQVTGLAAANDDLLDLSVDLVVSPEFAGFLQANNFATSDLTGADVGDARIVAAVPEPTGLAVAVLGLIAGLSSRRR